MVQVQAGAGASPGLRHPMRIHMRSQSRVIPSAVVSLRDVGMLRDTTVKRGTRRGRPEFQSPDTAVQQVRSLRAYSSALGVK